VEEDISRTLVELVLAGDDVMACEQSGACMNEPTASFWHSGWGRDPP
jgi:hypothetical protein